MIKFNNNNVSKQFRDMENKRIVQINEFMKKYESGEATLDELNSLMDLCVEDEMKLYE